MGINDDEIVTASDNTTQSMQTDAVINPSILAPQQQQGGFFANYPAFNRSILNTIMGAEQGVSPIVRDRQGNLLYNYASPAQQLEFQRSRITPEGTVALLDPGTGNVELFLADPSMKEAVFGAGRIISQGYQSPIQTGPGMTSVAQAAQSQNVQPPASVLNQSKALQMAEGTLGMIPTGYSFIRKSYDNFTTSFHNSLLNLTEKLGGTPDVNELGRSLKNSVQNFATNKDAINALPDNLKITQVPVRNVGFKAKASALYNALDDKVPPITVVNLNKTKQILNDVGNKITTNPALAKVLTPAEFESYKKALSGNNFTMTYGELQTFRTILGEKITDASLFTSASQKDLSRLYGALTQDMKAAAQANNALKDWQRANDFYKAGVTRLEGFLKRFNDPDFKAAPERIVTMLESSAKAKGGNLALLRAARRSVPDDIWSLVSINALQRLGSKTQGGEFSIKKFLFDYRNLSPGAKDILFKGTGNAQLSKSIDELAEIALAFEKSGTDVVEGSRTTLGVTTAAAGLGLTEAMTTGQVPIGTLLLGVSTAGSAKLLTFRPFVNWLATTSKTSDLVSSLSKLNTMARAYPFLAPEIKEYASQLAKISGAKPVLEPGQQIL
jgi:hypothetical protein